MLFFKLTLVPCLIALVALLGKRYGTTVAGLLSGFPIIAAPIIYFLSLEQGASFALHTAQSSILGIGALAVFCASYARISQRWVWWQAYGLAVLCFGGAAILLVQLSNHIPALLLALMVLGGCLLATPALDHALPALTTQISEIVWRMLCAVGLVFAVTLLAQTLGTVASGILAAFPVAASVLAIFSQRYGSAQHAYQAMRAVLQGLLSLLSFFVGLVYAAPYLSFGLAFWFGMSLAVLAQLVVLVIKRLMKPAAAHLDTTDPPL